MTHIKRSIPGLGLLAALLPLTGCFTAVKQTYYEIKGAQGEVRPNSTISDLALQDVKSLNVEPVKTTLAGKLCPPEAVRAVDAALRGLPEDLADDFPGGAPALTISSEINYFQKKGILSGGLLVLRVYMSGGGGAMVDSLVLGETKSITEGSERDMADAAARAIGEFILKHRYRDADDKIKNYRKRQSKHNER